MKYFKGITIFLSIFGLIGYFVYLAISSHLSISNNLERAEELFTQNDYPKALTHYEFVYNKSKKSAKGLTALFKIAQIKHLQKDTTAANFFFNIIKQKDLFIKKDLQSFYAIALFNYAKMQSNPEEAKKYFKQLLNDLPYSDLADNAVFELAMALKAENKPETALATLATIIKNYPNTDLLPNIVTETGNLNMQLMFSGAAGPYTEIYTVKPGDSLAAIAQKFKTTVAFIKKASLMQKSIIRPYDNLIVPKVVFSLVVDKSQNTLTLKANGNDTESVIKVYRVGTGKSNKTPIGTFKITSKLVDPPWYSKEGVIPPGDSRNLLGTRWLGINVPSYGIHGTTQPETIGSQSSAGCVRMLNREVEELYDMLPMGTEVIIID